MLSTTCGRIAREMQYNMTNIHVYCVIREERSWLSIM